MMNSAPPPPGSAGAAWSPASTPAALATSTSPSGAEFSAPSFSYEDLVDQAAQRPDWRRVRSGDPDHSLLLLKALGDYPGIGEAMPPRSLSLDERAQHIDFTPLDRQLLERIWLWINAGAPQ